MNLSYGAAGCLSRIPSYTELNAIFAFTLLGLKVAKVYGNDISSNVYFLLDDINTAKENRY